MAATATSDLLMAGAVCTRDAYAEIGGESMIGPPWALASVSCVGSNAQNWYAIESVTA